MRFLLLLDHALSFPPSPFCAFSSFVILSLTRLSCFFVWPFLRFPKSFPRYLYVPWDLDFNERTLHLNFWIHGFPSVLISPVYHILQFFSGTRCLSRSHSLLEPPPPEFSRNGNLWYLRPALRVVLDFISRIPPFIEDNCFLLNSSVVLFQLPPSFFCQLHGGSPIIATNTNFFLQRVSGVSLTRGPSGSRARFPPTCFLLSLLLVFGRPGPL